MTAHGLAAVRVGLAMALAAAGGAACARQPVVSLPAAPPPPVATRDDLFVVVPDDQGRVGAITVTHGTTQAVLDTAYATARITQPGRLEPGRSTAEEVDRIFKDALNSQPLPPVSFTLYFTFGTDELTPESRQALVAVAAEIARRPAGEIVVIGHTDRVGTVPQNDALSLQRAERVRREVIQQLGIAADRISIAGRGEREPLVPTEDEVPEPRNRRVEITVR